VPVWVGLAGVLGWNVTRHLLGKSTLCSSGRKTIPPLAFDAGWLALTLWLRHHYHAGFTPKEQHP